MKFNRFREMLLSTGFDELFKNPKHVEKLRAAEDMAQHIFHEIPQVIDWDDINVIARDHLQDLEGLHMPYAVTVFEVMMDDAERFMPGFLESYQNDPYLKFSTGGMANLKPAVSLMIFVLDFQQMEYDRKVPNAGNHIYFEPFVCLMDETDRLGILPAGVCLSLNRMTGETTSTLSPALESIGLDMQHDAIQRENIADVAFNYIYFVMYVVAMLDNDKMIEDDVRYKETAQRKRTKRGKPPFVEHKILTLGLPKRAYEHGETGESQTGRKMHYRRGHWRHFSKRTREGKTRTWIKPMMVGDPSLGIIHKDYYVRGEDE